MSRKNLKPLPIGIQTFSKIIEEDYLYVDKTEKIYNLIKQGSVYFLSRPRRFGKSLLVSTLEEIFFGNKELFKDLWIYNSDYDWKKHPVIRIDFSSIKPKTAEYLIQSISNKIDKIAHHNNVKLEMDTYYEKFEELISKLSEKGRVVILIDEYDKPLIDNIDNSEIAIEFREILKGFYSVIKSSDQYIRFVLLTGVSKFSRMSVFSGLNNLDDISMDEKYASLLGITQKELEKYFDQHINILAEKKNVDRKKLLTEIKNWYNGYRFSYVDVTVYNPFSTLLLFGKNHFNNYWFNTATPSFLIKLLKNNKENYNLDDIVGQEYGEAAFGSYELDNLDIVPLLFQTGYLTIKDYEHSYGEDLYTLDFPNREVKTSFNKGILENFLYIKTGGSADYISKIRKALSEKDLDGMLEILKVVFANIPYDIQIKQEKYYQTVFFSIFLLLGFDIESECRTNKGRIDAVLNYGDKIYIFEFKLDDTAENAIKQIKENEYFQKYIKSEKNKSQISPAGGGQGVDKENRKGIPYELPTTNYELFLIGVNFSTEEKNIKDWIVEKV
jgi:hypothetical protein